MNLHNKFFHIRSVLLRLLENLQVIFVFLLFAFLPSINIRILVNSTQSSPFIIFLYTISALLLFCSIKILFKKKIQFKWRIIHGVLVGLFLYITINRYYLQSFYGFSQLYFELIGLIILYFILSSLIDCSNYKYLLLAVVLGSIIQAVSGNLQLYGLYPTNNANFKITGNFFNPGPYAGYLASVFPVAVGLYLYKNITDTVPCNTILQRFMKKFNYIIAFVAIVVILLALAAANSRAAWLGAMAGCIFILFYRYKLISLITDSFNNIFKRTAVTTGILCLLIIIITGMYFLNKQSANGRLLVWKVTENMINDRPLIGYGFDQFKANYMDYQRNYFRNNINVDELGLADNTRFSFNEPLQFIVENGILGALLIIIILAFLIRSCKIESPVSIIGMAGLITIIVFSFFSYPSQILSIKLNAILYSVIIITTIKSKSYVYTNKKNGAFFFVGSKIIIALNLFILSFAIYQYARKIFTGFEKWQSAYLTYQTDDYTTAIDEYITVYPLFKNEGDFLLNYGKALSIAGRHQAAIKILNEASQYNDNVAVQTTLGDSYKALGNFKQAEIAYYNASFMCPGRFYAKYLLAKLYSDNHQNIKASIIAKELLNKKVKVQSQAINEILAEMRLIINK